MMPASILARGAVIGTAGVFGLGYSLSAVLIALVLSEQGYSDTVIGLNAAMHAVGVLLVAPALPSLAMRFGVRPLLVGALGGTALLLLVFGLAPPVWLTFLLRIGLGVCAEVMFVLSETWTNQLSDDASRGRAMASYTAVMSLGFAGGPLLLSVLGTAGMLPFAVSAGITVAAVGFVLLPGIPTPVTEPPHGTDRWRYFRLAPVALACTALNAAVETAGQSFLPLYAVTAGWADDQAARLIGVMMVGAIVLQLPIGWLADRVDRRRLMRGLAILAGLGALVWPFALWPAWLAYAVLFVWGGIFVGIYTIMLTIVGSRFTGADLMGVYATSGLMWGCGALLGPVMVGVAAGFTVHALPFCAAAWCLVFAGFIRPPRVAAV